jgi:hypothetical protein
VRHDGASPRDGDGSAARGRGRCDFGALEEEQKQARCLAQSRRPLGGRGGGGGGGWCGGEKEVATVGSSALRATEASHAPRVVTTGVTTVVVCPCSAGGGGEWDSVWEEGSGMGL